MASPGYKLVDVLRIPSLGEYGLAQADFPDLIEQACRASSMRGNPIQLTTDEMSEILSRAL